MPHELFGQEAPPAFTLKARVKTFWQWFSSVAQRFYTEIENQKCPDLQPEVSAKVDELLGGMAWVFGPGVDGGHSFTITPEGNPYQRFVARYWLDQAPVLQGWTFYAARQPSEGGLCSRLDVGGMEFGAAEIWMTPWVDEQKEKVDLTVWHPSFDKIPENLRWTVTFIYLDEALGEDGVVNWIGEIKMGDDKLAGAIPLSELPEFVREIEAKHGWKKYPPHEVVSGYQRREPSRGGVLREDVVAGTTRLMRLLQEYPLDSNPLEKFGADLVMIVIPTAALPQGVHVVEARGQIEDAIKKAFDPAAAGFLLGGAIGLENAYIDLLLCDGENSLGIVHRVLTEQGVADNAGLVSFVKS